tara:strand:+ start:2024 stop:3496 length:1473 start_codon:yes stop_codon:yes gene_type:complete
MKSRATIVFALSLFLFTTGCLDALRNSGDSDEFWGDDCNDLSEEICPSGKAPDFSLVDQNGNPVNLSLYENKIIVVSFLYTTCPDICPALTYQLRKLSEELEEDYGESVEFITITVDPERDTPERLSSFAANNNADWRFLTSVSNDSFGDMISIWADYRVYVDIDEEACLGNGHYMEGYDGCHCNPGFMQDSNDTFFGKDTCIVDPNYSSLNVSFEQGSLEYDIVSALEVLNEADGRLSEEFAIQAIEALISQHFPSSWTLTGTDNVTYKSNEIYNNNLTLLEFFHTDCSHCNTQIPALKDFHTDYSDKVDIISVGGYTLGGDNADNMSTITNFAEEHNVSWPYVYDDEYDMMGAFGLNSYPSWVLLEGNLSTGLPQVVGIFSGKKSYDELVEKIDNRSSPINATTQINEIIDYFGHWKQGHVSDTDMINIISDLLGYEYESETIDEVKTYGVSHSNKLYIIDKEGNVRVVWRGIEWTYASVYHDIQILL